jgi:hypothetical protein
LATGVEKTIRFSVGFITLQISYGENEVLSDCRLAVAAAVSGLKLILIVYLSFDIVILPNKNAYVNQMGYGLGSAMKTKLYTNGAVIGQRKGLSKVGRNTKAISNLQLGDI